MIDKPTPEVSDASLSATSEDVTAHISVTDLANIRQIIDVAVARGAFKANEFHVVGSTYDRLVAFLTAMTPPAGTSNTPNTDSDTVIHENADDIGRGPSETTTKG